MSTLHKNLPEVTIWTDGSIWNDREPFNPGKAGGWAAVLVNHKAKRVISGRVNERSTNNQMEVKAVLEALKALNCSCSITLRSDSQYTLGGLRKMLDGKSIRNIKKNKSLWAEVHAAYKAFSHRLTLEHVKAHRGNHYNEICDDLAKLAAKEGYEWDRRVWTDPKTGEAKASGGVTKIPTPASPSSDSPRWITVPDLQVEA